VFIRRRIVLKQLLAATLAVPFALAAFAQDKPAAPPVAEPKAESRQDAKPADGKEGKPETGQDGGKDGKDAAAGATAATAKSVLDFTMKDIDGRDVPLSKYRGRVLLIVNGASKCGLTPQYEQLEALQDKYGKEGLAVLVFPANNFNGQEPGTNKEIKEFCQGKYKASFDLFAKVSVKGDDQCELYKFLTSSEKQGERGGEIKWNFTKFLVGRDGKVLERFEPRTKPDDAKVTAAIEKALKG
jgi:glutathione peroxidase